MASWEEMAMQVLVQGRPGDVASAGLGWEALLKNLGEVQESLEKNVKDLGETWKGPAYESFKTHIEGLAENVENVIRDASRGDGIVEALKDAANKLTKAQEDMPIPASCIDELAAARNFGIQIDFGLFESRITSDWLKWNPGFQIGSQVWDWINDKTDEAREVYDRVDNQYQSNGMPGEVRPPMDGRVTPPVTPELTPPPTIDKPTPPPSVGPPETGKMPTTTQPTVDPTSLDPDSNGYDRNLPDSDLPTTNLPGDGEFPDGGGGGGGGTGGLGENVGSGLAGAGGGGGGGMGTGGLGGAPLPGGGSGAGLAGGGAGAGAGLAGGGALGRPVTPPVAPMMGGGAAGAGRGAGGRGAGRLGGGMGAPGMGGMAGPGAGAAGRGAGRGAGRPGMAGVGGAGGGAGYGDEEESRNTWLEEDEDVWGVDGDAAPGVLR